LTLRTYAKRQPPKLREALARDLPVHMLRSNSAAHIESFLFGLNGAQDGGRDDAGAAEAEAAVRTVLEQGEAVELSPQPPGTRRQQHEIAERHGLTSESRGREPYRRVVLYPARSAI
jgi:R3H domain